MRRILVAGCLGTVAACGPTTQTSAPGTRPATPAAADVETVVGTSNALPLVRDSDIASHPLAAGPEVLWGRLVEQFDELELPVTAFATSSRVIGTHHERLRRIGRQPVSRFFECPGTAFGNTASTEFLAVTVVAQLASRAEGGSDLRLVASSTTRPRSGGGGEVSEHRSAGAPDSSGARGGVAEYRVVAANVPGEVNHIVLQKGRRSSSRAEACSHESRG